MNRERMKKIGRLIFKKRKSMHLTQKELSEMLYCICRRRRASCTDFQSRLAAV